MKQERVKKPRTRVERDTSTEVHEDSRTQRRRQRGQDEAAALKEELDDLLSEIDAVLEQSEVSWEDFKQVGGE